MGSCHNGRGVRPHWQAESWSAYKAFLDIDGSEHFHSAPFEQSVEDFVRCQHSRDTFAPSRLAGRMNEFDGELGEMLAPYAREGKLSFIVRTKLVWGSIRL